MSRAEALQERTEALHDALTPTDWWETPRRSATLKCGCEARVVDYRDEENAKQIHVIWDFECREHAPEWETA
jgi:hypothetical protein